MSKDMFNLEGKVAIVTGASKGIGKSMAYGLAKHGAKVVISSRDQETLDTVSESFNKDGLDTKGIACHVGKIDDLKALVLQTKEAYGGVDILINNAATNPVFGKVSEAEADVFEKIMNVNLKACMLLSNLCYPIMVKRGGGSVINIASIEGIKPSNGLAMYSMSKAALISLTKSQALEWGRNKIRSNAICPGLIQTKFSKVLWDNEEMLSKFVKHIPAKRMGQPEELAGLALFLASDASSYCTGSSYVADGGYLI
jgi:NAD(P)-dependent dehydrogenase (short-subunit alcohol dehydrogenase family)